MIAQYIVRFYDKPRNRFLCFLGAFLIGPVVRMEKSHLARMEAKIADKTMLLGRLELTEKLITRWWTK